MRIGVKVGRIWCPNVNPSSSKNKVICIVHVFFFARIRNSARVVAVIAISFSLSRSKTIFSHSCTRIHKTIFSTSSHIFYDQPRGLFPFGYHTLFWWIFSTPLVTRPINCILYLFTSIKSSSYCCAVFIDHRFCRSYHELVCDRYTFCFLNFFTVTFAVV